MATLFNNVANTLTTNFVPVQATFDTSGNFLTFIGPGGVPFTTGGGSLTVNTTAITGGTSGRVLFDNAGTVGELATTGTGSVVLSASPTLSGTVNLSNLTASQAVFTDASKNVVSKATTGTGSVVLSDGATMTGSVIIGSGSATANVQLGSGSAVNTIFINKNGSSGSTVTIGNNGNNGTCNIQNGAGSNQTVNIASYNDPFSPPTSGKTVYIGGGPAASKDIYIGTDSTNVDGNQYCYITIGSFLPNGQSNVIFNGDFVGCSGTYFKPPSLSSAPAVYEGAMYYDTTLHKLRICDNVGWKSITAI